MTPSQANTLAVFIDEAVKAAELFFASDASAEMTQGASPTPEQYRSKVEDHIVGGINEGIAHNMLPSNFLQTLGARDIHNMMDNDPRIPNVAPAPATSAPGVQETINPAYVTKVDLTKAMQANNDALIAAMTKIIAEQNAAKH